MNDFFENNDFKKTLLVDFSNISYATFCVLDNINDLKNDDEKYAYWRYLILNGIKKCKIKHKPTEIIITIDSKTWRKKIFPYYKAKRADARKKANFDYETYIEKSNEFIKELDEIFDHFKIIRVNGAEADDIIAILTHELKDKRDQIVIASNDKDFKQLIRKNVKLYSIREEKFIKVDDPKEYLISHILSGDASDGVPNVRSDDDTFIAEGKRQKPCGPKTISKILESGLESWIKENKLERNFARNRKLVELNKRSIPTKLWDIVLKKYDSIEDKKPKYNKIMMYFGKHKLKNFIKEQDKFM